MCNVFSGLIVTEKGKDWGKVLFSSGVHHENDRSKYMKKYGDNLLGWESKEEYSLVDGFKFTHTMNVSMREEKELMGLVEDWAGKQDKNKLLRSMITVSKDNKPTDDFEVLDGVIKCGDRTSLVCDFKAYMIGGDDSTQKAGDKSTQNAGYNSTQTAGYNSTQSARDDSTQKAGDKSTQNAGYKSTQTAGYKSTQKAGGYSTQKAGGYSTQTAGDESTQTAGYKSTQKAGGYSTQTAGGYSTQTAGDESTCVIYGDVSYVILDGRNVLLTQIYYLKNKFVRSSILLDKLFRKYKKGDKLKIVKGKVVGKED